jgi:hypothetical protein
MYLDYREYRRFMNEVKNTEFTQRINPMYHTPIVDYDNVAYGLDIDKKDQKIFVTAKELDTFKEVHNENTQEDDTISEKKPILDNNDNNKTQ